MAKRQTHATPMRKKTDKNQAMGKDKAAATNGGKRPTKPAKGRDATSINPKKEEPITPNTPVMHPA
jgi:hypothetical protein